MNTQVSKLRLAFDTLVIVVLPALTMTFLGCLINTWMEVGHK